MLVHRLRRWPNIETVLDECLVFSGLPAICNKSRRTTRCIMHLHSVTLCYKTWLKPYNYYTCLQTQSRMNFTVLFWFVPWLTFRRNWFQVQCVLQLCQIAEHCQFLWCLSCGHLLSSEIGTDSKLLLNVVERLVTINKWNEMNGILGHLCAHIG